MSRVCVLIGEGISERYFLPSLLQHQYNFTSQADKHPHVYKKQEDLFWFFPFPPGSSTPEGGKDRLRKTNTFRIANAMVDSHSYLFGNAPQIHYQVIVDHQHGDDAGQRAKKADIENAIKTSGILYAGHKVSIVENEIECWYFAGMSEDFPYINRSRLSEFRSLMAMRPESISNPKAHMKGILSEELHGPIKMAEAMGQYMNLQQARERSASFHSFLAPLEAEGLV